jgi:hypothetical protein
MPLLPPGIELRFSDRPARSLFIILLCSGTLGRKSVLHNQMFFSKGLHVYSKSATNHTGELPSSDTGFPQRMETFQNVLKYAQIKQDVRSRISPVSCLYIPGPVYGSLSISFYVLWRTLQVLAHVRTPEKDSDITLLP